MNVFILKNYNTSSYIKLNYTCHICISWLYYLLCILEFLLIMCDFKEKNDHANPRSIEHESMKKN